MSFNSAIAAAMGEAAYGATLGHVLGDLRDQVSEERALRLHAEADVRVLRTKVRALEVYVQALKDHHAA